MTKLSYIVGKTTVQTWHLPSKTIAYWMKSKLLIEGGYEMGVFKVEAV